MGAICECHIPGCLCRVHDVPRPATFRPSGPDTGHDELREALRRHVLTALDATNPLYYDDCANGLADALLPVVEAHARRVGLDRAQQAWDEGFDAGYLHVPGDDEANPYAALAAADDSEDRREFSRLPERRNPYEEAGRD